MNLPLKISIGIGTLGSLSGGAYLIHKELSADNILKKLEKEGYSKLDKKVVIGLKYWKITKLL